MEFRDEWFMWDRVKCFPKVKKHSGHIFSIFHSFIPITLSVGWLCMIYLVENPIDCLQYRGGGTGGGRGGDRPSNITFRGATPPQTQQHNLICSV